MSFGQRYPDGYDWDWTITVTEKWHEDVLDRFGAPTVSGFVVLGVEAPCEIPEDGPKHEAHAVLVLRQGRGAQPVVERVVVWRSKPAAPWGLLQLDTAGRAKLPRANTGKQRKTPTEKQIERVQQLDGETLVARALEAMRALNRRAKHGGPLVEEIYSIKDDLLTAVLRANRAKLYHFSHATSWEHSCCGRTWYGSDPTCWSCRDDADESVPLHRTWYLVDCGGEHRFHRPDVPKDLRALATPMQSHDPTQPAREIPNVGLTIQAQLACVRLATTWLQNSHRTAAP